MGSIDLPSTPPATTASRFVGLNSSNFHIYSDVLVLVTLNWDQGVDNTTVQSAAVVWTSKVLATRNGFDIFSVSPSGYSVTPKVNWIAYQINIHTRTNNLLYGGQMDLNQFSHGSYCTDLTHDLFEPSGNPVISLYQKDTAEGSIEGVASWLEKDTSAGKRACVHEITHFGGSHDNWKVNFLKLGPKLSASDEQFKDNVGFAPRYRQDDEPWCQDATYDDARDSRQTFITRTQQVSPLKTYSQFAFESWIQGGTNDTLKMCYDYTVDDSGNSRFNVLSITNDGTKRYVAGRESDQ